MTKKNLFLVLTFFFCYAFLFAQQGPIDSLKTALKNAKHDTTRCTILNLLVEAESDDKIWPIYNDQLLELAQKRAASTSGSDRRYYLAHVAGALNNIGYLAANQGDASKALENYQKSLKIKEEIQDKKGIAASLNNIGFIYQLQGDISKALEYFQKSAKILEESDDKKEMAYALLNIGSMYDNQGDIRQALEYYHKSLKILEEIGDKNGIASGLANIGLVYESQNDLPKALEYFNKSLKIREEIEDKMGIAMSLGSIGYVCKIQADSPDSAAHRERLLNKALNYYQQSLKIQEEIMHKEGIASSLKQIGDIYLRQADGLVNAVQREQLLNRAIESCQKGLTIYEEISSREGIAQVLNNMASTMIAKGDLPNAQKYATRGLQIGRELGFPDNIGVSAGILNRIYKKQNKFKEALEMFELEIQMRDSINNKETRKAALKKQFQYEYEKKQAVADAEHKSEMEKQKAVADEENRKQNIIIWSVVIGLLLVIVFSGFILRSLNITRKQKQIIELKNKETETQKHLIEEKQKEIIDSITYARRIQRSLLPTEKYIMKILTKSKAR